MVHRMVGNGAWLLLISAGFLAPTGTVSALEAARPNIVILLADDLGWKDVGYHGSEIKTPNIDRLAREGVELDRFYVCPVCSPTRAGLMTGRYPIRYGLMRAVITPWCGFGLATDEVTLPQMLAQAGYERRAILGKWHLGHSKRKYHPLLRGFTHFYGHYNGAIDYFTHLREKEIDWHRGFESIDQEGYTTDLLAEEAVRFVEQSPSGTPFFLYVPFNAVHSPLQAPESELAANSHIQNRRRRTQAAMASRMDQAIGKILSALEEKGVAEDTLVLFFSDNGGVAKPTSNNDPLRGRKATVFEGGIRVPAAIRWPMGIEGGKKVTVPMAFIDILPTLQALVGVQDHGGKPLDGIDVLDVIRGDKKTLRREILAYIGQSGEDSEQICVISPEWKLIVIGPNVLLSTPNRKREILLFRIILDPYEQNDVSDEHPEVVERLLRQIVKFRSLQPANKVPPHGDGRKGFVAPKNWEIPKE